MKRTKYITYLFLCLLYGLLSSCSFEQEDSTFTILKQRKLFHFGDCNKYRTNYYRL